MKSPLVIGALLLGLTSIASAQQPPPQPQPTDPPADAAEPAEPADAGTDVDALRQEYLKLRDELFASRARAATVASTLYSTKITVKLSYTSGRFYGVEKATIRLDGAKVYEDVEGVIATDDAVRFEGWIAPGRHQLSIRVEAIGKDDERFTSATEATFVVQAVAGKDLIVVSRAKDGGDIPYEWKRGEHGTYRLAIDADVKTVARADAPPDKPKKKAKVTKKKPTRTAKAKADAKR
jgi:hypothetical protein